MAVAAILDLFEP